VAGDQVFQQNVNTKLDPQFGFGDDVVQRSVLPRPEHAEAAAHRVLPDRLARLRLQPGQRPHYFLSGGYVFDLGLYHKFKPTFLVKAVQGAP
jgi:hypothetical protein